MNRTTGKIEIRATALSMIVHGAGTSGNTQHIRTAPWVTPEGEIVEVQMLSGNSLKHQIREGAASYAIDAMGVADHSLTKAKVDLLFSGGHLSKSGAAVDLAQARAFEALFPPLSLCGYSAGNVMTQSKISVSDLNVVCAENRNRMPDDMLDHPHAKLYASMLLADAFGTRHDMAQRTTGRRLLTEAANEAQVKRRTKALKKPSREGTESAESPDPIDEVTGETAQMLYEFGGIMAGSVLYGEILVHGVTELERAALASAFQYLATDRIDGRMVMRVGAKSSIGYGKIAVELRGSIRVDSPRYVADTALVAAGDTLAERYTAHMREHRDEILAALDKAIS